MALGVLVLSLLIACRYHGVMLIVLMSGLTVLSHRVSYRLPTSELSEVSGVVTKRIGQSGGLLDTDHGHFYLPGSYRYEGCQIRTSGRWVEPYSPQNPGEFNFKQWLGRHNVGAIWKIKHIEIQSCRWNMRRLFYSHGMKLLDQFDLKHREVIQSIMIGGGIRGSALWNEFGLFYLLVASGYPLYITMRAIRSCARNYKMSNLCEVVLYSILCSYAYLLGAKVYVYRGLIIYLYRRLTRNCESNLVWGSTVLCLIVDPMIIFSQGWWLSCYFIMNSRRYLGGLSWVEKRLIDFVVMGAVLSTHVSLIPYAYVVKPIIELMVVPMLNIGYIISIFSESISGLLLLYVDQILSFMHQALSSFYGIKLPVLFFHYSKIASVLSWGILRVYFNAPKYIGLLMLTVLPSSRLPVGHVEMHTLAVGHGLSILIRTRNHQLLYDVGSSSIKSVSDRMVLPFLRHIGVNRLDHVVISHPDYDHISGLNRVIESTRVDHVWTSSPLLINVPQSLCHRGAFWRWDGVLFKFIHPDQNNMMSKNNQSCVLEVTTDGGKVLLTGDIESKAEQYIMDNNQLEKIEVLVAPHHGRSTSSSPEFIAKLNPDIIIISDQHHKIRKSILLDQRAQIAYHVVRV